MAEAAARRWKKGEPLSPLDGVPILIKDLLLTKGWPTRRGSKTIEAVSGEVDAPSVARLREAGCVFVGLTTTPEFGWKGVTDSPLTGITRNPWNPALDTWRILRWIIGSTCGGLCTAGPWNRWWWLYSHSQRASPAPLG